MLGSLLDAGIRVYLNTQWNGEPGISGGNSQRRLDNSPLTALLLSMLALTRSKNRRSRLFAQLKLSKLSAHSKHLEFNSNGSSPITLCRIARQMPLGSSTKRSRVSRSVRLRTHRLSLRLSCKPVPKTKARLAIGRNLSTEVRYSIPATPASLRLSIFTISQVGGRCVCQSAVAALGGGTL